MLGASSTCCVAGTTRNGRRIRGGGAHDNGCGDGDGGGDGGARTRRLVAYAMLLVHGSRVADVKNALVAGHSAHASNARAARC